MSNNDEISKISKPVIKGKTPIYHLISEEKLTNLKNNGIAQDFAMLFSSIFIGAFLGAFNFLMLLAGIIFLGFALYFYIQKDSFIKSFKSSGKIESFETTKNKSHLKIIKATYGTQPNKIFDVTKELNDKIADDSLKIKASNQIKGDPNMGIVKNLDIKYKIGDKKIDKRYKEGDFIDIP